jgi:hypothetical protein
MEAHNSTAIEQAEAARQSKLAEERLKQAEEENAHTVGTYMKLLQGRNPQGRFDYTANGLCVTLESKASIGTGLEDDDFKGPWDKDWRPSSTVADTK